MGADEDSVLLWICGGIGCRGVVEGEQLFENSLGFKRLKFLSRILSRFLQGF
jgi:hypothetical protein